MVLSPEIEQQVQEVKIHMFLANLGKLSRGGLSLVILSLFLYIKYRETARESVSGDDELSLEPSDSSIGRQLSERQAAESHGSELIAPMMNFRYWVASWRGPLKT